MKKLSVKATRDGMKCVSGTLETLLEEYKCPLKEKMEFLIAFEELFVNIVRYAYGERSGDVVVSYDVKAKDTGICSIWVELTDQGLPYNPLQREALDVTLTAADRKIGGLGIYIAKKFLDEISYEDRSGQNVLSFQKQFLTDVNMKAFQL